VSSGADRNWVHAAALSSPELHFIVVPAQCAVIYAGFMILIELFERILFSYTFKINALSFFHRSSVQPIAATTSRDYRGDNDCTVSPVVCCYTSTNRCLPLTLNRYMYKPLMIDDRPSVCHRRRYRALQLTAHEVCGFRVEGLG